VALIVPDIADLAFPALIRAAQLEAYREGLCMFLGNSDEDARLEERLITQFSGQVDGIVLAAPRLSIEAIKAIAKPVVLINRDIAGVPRVLVDSTPGVAEALTHLRELGHRRVAYVGGPAGSWSAKLRRTAVTAAAANQGMKLDAIDPAAPSPYEAGRLAARDIAKSPATAVLAYDDTVAQGVIAGLAAEGLVVPRAMSVISCEEVMGAAAPTLTTIGSRMADAGKVAVGLLIDALETAGLRDASYRIDAHLIVRSSTGPAVKR
jgi:LacI family transcriptional regulator